jgi:small membrane protein
MIAQLMLTAFLLGILLYALTEYRRSPAVGLIAVFAAVGGLYFVWVPSHATHLAEFVGIGRGVDLIIYIWIVISLLLLTQSPPQAARAYGADHRTGEGTCHRERPLASIDVMSPRVAGPPWRSVDSSGLSVSRRRYSRATDHRPWV